ncbi:formate dehydrogenase subunit alpha [Neoroseomonas oryzicola]|uniref:Formate dehydrogenase subunit alpha n=1 Tax=Neoroseomonas oryzicola TaxID=535904 RepID=A0A9X9WIT5_9PROT|nr:formate dehydrogenase subunit alpha [Neoroseomonas oryzicola]MBR0660245.1 formate dehydrogenase subunit alpha [Neoroseomonas oryzicola]NKE16680.1 formate dehydrogenase subunit alpha [Neoroseomonas oryzicola]
MLIKRSEARAGKQRLAAAYAGLSSGGLDRRAFLKRAGVTGFGLSALGAIPLTTVRPAKAGPVDISKPITRVKNICTHCSVGCTVTAEVQNGVWVGQEPTYASPINRGTHCAKGASVRELVHGDRRIKYPMKLVNGQWQRMTWDAALGEIGEKLMAVRQASGPDSVFWLGSAKFSNEGAYLFRKFAAFWGTNNVDHQARICHSTTVAGVANTWGYGAQTNSYNDIRNAKTMIIMGGNPAEAHPVSLQHVLSGKEMNRANMIVIDPRFTRTAAHATEYVRIRPGTDIPIIWGMLWHIFQNGWEDKEFIRQRVYGMDDVRAEVAKWTPAEVERVTGVPGAQLRKVAEMFATQKPSTLIWCMGATQKTVGTANVRAYSILLLATGNVGKEGTGANIFRGHCNVQGATDFGLDVTSLPAYYGLDENAWRHWSRVWGVSYESMIARFDSKAMMETPGIPTTRYFDAVTMPVNAQTGLAQRDNFKAMMVFGHGGNTVTRMPEAVKGLEKLDLLVVADPHPTTFAVLANRRENTYLLPICTQFETNGSRTASNRSIQWGSQVVKPIFESKDDYEAMYRLAGAIDAAAQKRNMTFRMQAEVFKDLEIKDNAPTAESILREINRGAISTGYTGQSPERLKLHMQHQDKFDLVTLRAKDDAPAEIRGDFYGLPWPCWGKPEWRHPGSHILYNTNLHVKEGGGTFRARFGVERNGVSLLADGSFSKGSELTDGYPEFTTAVMARLGWDAELTAEEKASIQRQGGTASWATDLSMGIIRVTMEHGVMAYGNAKARANAWNLPDPVPVHREPIYTPRTDLIAQYPTLSDRRGFRLPNIGQTVQNRAKDLAPNFPIILSSGRLVEYEGGGEETRSNRWLAELQQDMFIEINPRDAASRNIRDGAWVLVNGPEMPQGKAVKVKALVTERVGAGVAWMPFHFAGWFMQEDQRSKYPQGSDPIVLGESVNAVTTYGYDPVTFMQETKVTLCQIRAA